MYILGISCFYHDSAATLIHNGEIIAAAQEERFTRKKHDPSFPINSIEYVLREASINLNEVKFICFYDKPFLKFERLLETYLGFSPKGFKSFKMAMPVWIKEKLFLKSLILKELRKVGDFKLSKDKILFSEHHFSHAASAFFPSPFEEAIVLTIDGVGEWATTTISLGRGSNLDIIKEIHFPHSLGLLYSAFTYFLGFRVNSGEYKVMGLAPYGEPKYKEKILDNLIDVKKDGSFRLNQKYFNYATGLEMTNDKFSKLFNRMPRKPEVDELEQFHMDLAASLQVVIEEIVLKMCMHVSKEYKIDNLCLAGGVALNCVANGKILESDLFNDIWIQPAAGDAGGSLGSALSAWYCELGNKRIRNKKDSMKGSYLGSHFSDDEIEERLEKEGAKFFKFDSQDKMIRDCAKEISEGKAIGWFQGRMEFGPRALGARSILADPRSGTMQKTLNLKVKYRESFRPFAPSVLLEDSDKYFELSSESPYMLLVSYVKNDLRINPEIKDNFFGIEKLKIKRSTIPAVTHVDYSARIQTVSNEFNPVYHSLLENFKLLTGCSVLINTSFNVRGEPIVESPEDAFRCLMGTELDALYIGNYRLNKNEQDQNLSKNYRDIYELD